VCWKGKHNSSKDVKGVIREILPMTLVELNNKETYNYILSTCHPEL